MNSFDQETNLVDGPLERRSDSLDKQQQDLLLKQQQTNEFLGAYNAPSKIRQVEAPLISFGLAVFSWDVQRGKISFSGNWEPITGSNPEAEKSIRFLLELVHPEDYGSIYLAFSDLIHGRLYDLEREARLSETHSKHEKWVLIRATTERGEFGQVLNIHGGLLDITAYKSTEKKVADLSRTDLMTGLPNRQHLLKYIENLHQSPDTPDDAHKKLDIVILDIDRFRRINESLGEEAGDKIIKMVADRLKEHLDRRDFLARLGGDQFAIATDFPAQDQPHGDSLQTKLENIRQIIEKPFSLAPQNTNNDNVTKDDSIDTDQNSNEPPALEQISLEINMGLRRTCLKKQISAQTLLRDASLALREAKENTTASYSEFHDELHEKLLSSVQFENMIRQALAEDWVQVHYQPVIDSATGKAIGFEALARIQHPIQGIISPGIFIPVAEETGQIRDITEVIIKKSMRQLADWLEDDENLKDMTMAINLSPVQFENNQILDILEANLKETGLRGENIKVEVTESLLIKSMSDTRKILDAIKDMGIQICIDDFGTGYSSLSYIRNYEFDTLKIDRSFIEHITNEPRDAELVRSIIQMGQNVGMKIIVEGVENEDQQTLLTRLGCNYVQGFLVARPLPADKIAPWLECNHIKTKDKSKDKSTD